MNTIEEIRSLQEQIKKKTGELKVELARQLDAACRTLDLLFEIGEKEVLIEPQYYDYLGKLNVSHETLERAKRSTKFSPENKGEIKAALMLVLESANGFKQEQELRREVERMVERKISQLHGHLNALIGKDIVEKRGNLYGLNSKFQSNAAPPIAGCA